MEGIEIAHRRMRSLRLSGPPFDRPERAVGWLCGVQSQEYGPAKWAVGQRTTGATDAALDQALASGSILRTHVLRPTWHFVTPADIRWMLELTGPRVDAMNASRYRDLGLDDGVLARSRVVLRQALTGGKRSTRKQLAARLDGKGISASGPRLGYILMSAELKGLICSGAPQGKQQTYALLEERAPVVDALAYDEALAELTLRYFTSHGPATAKDFRWWSSLTLTTIKQGLEVVGSQLEHEIIDGVTYWTGDRGRSRRPTSPTVHLLQGYDEYIVGYTESKYVFDVSGEARSRQGRTFNGVVILDGQVAGRWKRTLTKDAVVVEVSLYAAFDKRQTKALESAAERHGRFLGLTPTLVTNRS